MTGVLGNHYTVIAPILSAMTGSPASMTEI